MKQQLIITVEEAEQGGQEGVIITTEVSPPIQNPSNIADLSPAQQVIGRLKYAVDKAVRLGQHLGIPFVVPDKDEESLSE